MANAIDALTLGPISQQVKTRASKQQWSKIVKTAHARGFQVEDFLDQTIPNAMKSRTQSSLRNQATSTIQAAYAPAEKDLTDQEQRVQAIDTKRARDNQYYTKWLTDRQDQLNTSAKAADAEMLRRQQAIQDDAANSVRNLRTEIAQGAAAAGARSDFGQSTQNQQIEADTTRNQAMIANERQASSDQIATNQSRQAELDASQFAAMAAVEAKRVGDTWGKLSDLGNSRQKLQLQKAADTAQEVAKLIGDESTKANQRQQNAIAAGSLNVDLTRLNQQSDQFNQTLGLNKDKLSETIRNNKSRVAATREQNSIANGFRQAQLDISAGKLELGWWKAKHPSKGGGSGGGGPSAKSKNPQDRFDFGYALVATSKTAGKPGSGNKPGTPGKAYTPEYVGKNAKLVENQLVASGLTRKMAQGVVTSFVTNGRDRNKDPGNYKDWLKGDSRPG